MFAIDLLKGQGRPAKSSPARTLLKAVPFFIPVIAIAAWAASYHQDTAHIRLQKAMAEKNETVIEAARSDMKEYRELNGQIGEVKEMLKTVTRALNYRIQMTDILVELTRTLPEQVFLYEIDLQREAMIEKIEKEKNKEPQEQVVIRRRLILTICGFDPARSDIGVREYVNKLKESDVLEDIFVDVKAASRRQGLVDRRPATYYEIECTLVEQRQP